MAERFLSSGQPLDDVLGPHRFKVISKRILKNGFVTNNGLLEELWPTKGQAFHCARQRVKEGYRVEVSRIVGCSAADRE